MGLCINTQGLEKTYNGGYITFGNFRFKLAEKFNKKYGEYYRRWALGNVPYMPVDKLTDDEFKDWEKLGKELNDEGLWLFLKHSDCDGKLTPKECKKIYDAIKDMQLDFEGHSYNEKESYNMLERFKEIFKHCYQRRVNLYFD